MTLESFIEHFGYFAVFVGSLLEGETVLLIAAFAASRGHLVYPWVVVLAFVGSIIGDQFYFFLGRHRGQRILARFPQLQARATKVETLLYRYHKTIILALRFLYGLRTIGPIVVGLSRVPIITFFLLNLISAGIWANTIGGIGYLFGDLLTLTNIRPYEITVMAFIASAILLTHVALRYWRTK